MSTMPPATTTADVVLREESLWRTGNFLKYVMGYTSSGLASQISTVAIPLVAVLTLHATSFEVGLMRSASQIPFLLFVLAFGVIIDRFRRRPMLVLADLGRAAVLALVPIGNVLGFLSIPSLCLIAFLVGICSVLFDVGAQAYLPGLVRRADLARGNSIAEALRSTSTIAGPAIGGLAVSAFGAPNAVVFCVVACALSAVSVWSIRNREARPEADTTGESAVVRIKAGFTLVFGNPILRSVVGLVALFNFAYAAYMTVYVVYLPDTLKLSAFAIGLAFAAEGPGLLVGAWLASWLPGRVGYGPVLTVGAIAGGAFLFGVPALHGNGWLTVTILMLLNFVYSTASMLFALSLVVIRQSITPNHMLGRVAATHRFLGVGIGVPLGSLVGGFLGQLLGLRLGVLVVVIAMIIVSSMFTFTKLRSVGRELPEPISS